MRFIYRDAETASEIEPKTISVIELNREHLIRYVLHTKNGDVVLRNLPWRMKQIIDDARFHLYPKVKELIQEVNELRPYVEGIPEDNVPKDKAERLNRIYHELRATDMYALGVIVAPCVATMDDVDFLYSQLDENDQLKLSLAVQALSSITSFDSVDSTALEIAQANGLQLMDKEMLEMLTVSQANYYFKRIEAENERIKQITNQQEKVVF